MRLSILKNYVKKKNVKMGFSHAEHISFPRALPFFFPLSVIPSSQHLNKEQSRFRENITDPALRTKPLLGSPVSQNSQRNSLKADFLFDDDISDKTITHLSSGCAKNYQRDIFQRIWGTVAAPIDPC